MENIAKSFSRYGKNRNRFATAFLIMFKKDVPKIAAPVAS
jgi:hypothetical protein